MHRSLTFVGPIFLAVGLLAVAPGAAAQEPRADPAVDAAIEARIAEAMAHGNAGLAHQRGEPGGEPEGYERCADAFVELYNEYEDYARADSLLFNAAICLDAAHRYGAAVQTRRALVQRYPESDHARDTLLTLAESYAAVAYYAEAATHFEAFAAHYPKHEAAPAALENAYLFRLGLDEPEAAVANLERYESLYARKDPKTAAAIFWSRQDLLRSDDERRDHALAYLKRYTHEGGADRQIVAEAVIAQIDWRRSCREPLILDSCISIERDASHPSLDALAAVSEPAPRPATQPTTKPKSPRYRRPDRCGASSQAIVTVHERNAKLAAAAQDRLSRIVKLLDTRRVDIPEDDLRRIRAFQAAWAMTLVYRADAKLEDDLRLTPPANLDFFTGPRPDGPWDSPAARAYRERLDRADDSKKRLAEFFEAKVARAQDLSLAYTAVEATQDPGGLLAAAAHTAFVYLSFADQLARAPIPAKLRDEARVDRYCEELADQAAPVREHAIAALTYCVERSTEYQHFDASSRWCEAELRRAQPTKYPATVELFGEPGLTSAGIEAAGPVFVQGHP